MVIGSRFMSKESKEMIPRYRKIGQNILTTATNFGNSVKISDSQSGYRAFTKDILGGFAYSEAGMGIESEMIRSAVRSGARIKEISIAARYHGLETSTYRPGSHGIKVVSSILRAVRSEHPLLYFGITGIAAFVTGLASGLYAIMDYFSTNVIPIGPAMLALMMILIGVLLTLVGLILNAISTISDGGRGR